MLIGSMPRPKRWLKPPVMPKQRPLREAVLRLSVDSYFPFQPVSMSFEGNFDCWSLSSLIFLSDAAAAWVPSLWHSLWIMVPYLPFTKALKAIAVSAVFVP